MSIDQFSESSDRGEHGGHGEYLSERQMFKVAFISQCIEHGKTTPGEIMELAESLASKIESEGDSREAFKSHEKSGFDITKSFKNIADSIKALSDVATGVVIPIGAAAPVIAGAVGGTMLGRMNDYDPSEIESIKNQELVNEYRRQAEILIKNREGKKRREIQDLGKYYRQ